MSDKIKPKYYKVVGDYDVLDIIKALSEKSTLDGFTDHCRFHALKYLFRAGLKDDALQDLKKAAEFLAIGVKHLEEKINQDKLAKVNKQYTMKDISNIERKIQSIENITTTVPLSDIKKQIAEDSGVNYEQNMDWRP